MLTELILPLAQAACDELLLHHDSFDQFANQHTGKSILICLTDLDMTLTIHLFQSGLLVSEYPTETPHTSITANLAGLKGMLGKKDPSGIINIHGDTELGMGFQKLMSSKLIDWDALLESFIGQTATVGLMEVLSGTLSWAKGTKSRLATQTLQYLTQETELAVDKQETDWQYEQCMQLIHQIQSLELRLEKIEQ